MTDEQKQREADKRYKDEQKRREANRGYKDNMSDERKQKLRDYQIDYQQKYYAAKKLNKIINDNDSDNDFYCISIIIKLKNIVPIKDINSILKKVCSQAYLEEYNFIKLIINKYKKIS